VNGLLKHKFQSGYINTLTVVPFRGQIMLIASRCAVKDTRHLASLWGSVAVWTWQWEWVE